MSGRGNVLRFPDRPVTALRRQLARCHSQRMLDRWAVDFARERKALSEGEVEYLAYLARQAGGSS